MTRVLHVIDRTCDETALQVLNTLRCRLGGDGGSQRACCIDAESLRRAPLQLSGPIVAAPRRLGRCVNWVPLLPRLARDCGAEVLHAWGSEAAAAACSARLPDIPLVITLLDPQTTPDAARWMGALPTRATVVAGSQVIRSRLVAAGAASDRVVVVRGPVDFGAVNQARRDGLRAKVVGEAGPVLLFSGPASREGGHYFALWGAAILQKIMPNLTVILPYDSAERRRLVRFAGRIDAPSLVTLPDPRLTWAELVTCADAFVMPAAGEVCTEPLGMAMGAGLVVVGVAVRSVAEIIADRSNGLLCKNGEPRVLASRVLTALEDGPLRQRVTETARGQAYEVFGVRAFLDNYRRVYENVLAGRPPAQDVHDTAMIA